MVFVWHSWLVSQTKIPFVVLVTVRDTTFQFDVLSTGLATAGSEIRCGCQASWTRPAYLFFFSTQGERVLVGFYPGWCSRFFSTCLRLHWWFQWEYADCCEDLEQVATPTGCAEKISTCWYRWIPKPGQTHSSHRVPANIGGHHRAWPFGSSERKRVAKG